MKKSVIVVALAVLGGGCAHQQAAQAEVVARPATPPPAPSQVVVSASADAGDDSLAALDRALKNATVYFDFDADTLKPEGLSTLQQVGEVLRKHPSLKIRIDGNCDERGTEEYNLLLGEKRAAVAKKYLLALGAADSQVDTLSYGDERPAVPGHSEDAWAKNRRDDLVPVSSR